MDTNTFNRLLELAVAQGRLAGDLNRADRNAIRREELRLRRPLRRRQRSGVERLRSGGDSARVGCDLHYGGRLSGEAELIFRSALIV